MINWEAIGAGAAVGAVVFALLQAFTATLRSSILYTARTLHAKVDKRTMYALHLELHNFSLRHIDEFVARLDCSDEPVGFEVVKTSSINKKTISTKFEDGQLLISVKDFPRFEKIHFDVFANCFLSDFRPLSGGGKNYVIKPKKDWLWNRANLAWLAFVFFINFLLWRR